jgi:hypothetical protein
VSTKHRLRRGADIEDAEESKSGATPVYIKKVKQSRYKPGVAQRVPGSYGSQIT